MAIEPSPAFSVITHPYLPSPMRGLDYVNIGPADSYKQIVPFQLTPLPTSATLEMPSIILERILLHHYHPTTSL